MSRPNGLTLKAWRLLFDESAERADEILPGLAEISVARARLLRSQLARTAPVGICHADLFLITSSS